ncbi:hypothetical protein LTR85_010499 [Meristemomyces frigidus]|nr:hypothetical protein LTR85_010499 [Meristemomyces frigidus]
MAKPPVSFMDLATEIRLEIYGWLFNTFSKDCPPPDMAANPVYCPNSRTVKHAKQCEPPTLCQGVPVAVLRANNKVYHEALPVMLESVNYVVHFDPSTSLSGHWTTLERLVTNSAIAPHVRSLTVATDMASLKLVNRKSANVGVCVLCKILHGRLPKLGELRLHVDMEVYDMLKIAMLPLETDAHLFTELLSLTRVETISIGLHQPDGTKRTRQAGDAMSLSAWVGKVVERLSAQAEGQGQAVRFKVWQ